MAPRMSSSHNLIQDYGMKTFFVNRRVMWMTANAKNGFLEAYQEWQNVRLSNPVNILMLNLMPTKKTTERQFLKAFNHMKQDVSLTFAYPASHSFKNTSAALMAKSYTKFSEASKNNYDALIITGTPIETLTFDQVDYWQEFKQIIAWSHHHVKQSLFECWAAQAALAVEFNIKKVNLDEKTFGIYSATEIDKESPLVTGIRKKKELKIPQSRHTTIEHFSGVKVVASNAEIGPMILHAPQINQTYLTGHPEYEADTLEVEYKRDLNKKEQILAPKNYFDGDGRIRYTWQNSRQLIYQNWLNLISKADNTFAKI